MYCLHFHIRARIDAGREGPVDDMLLRKYSSCLSRPGSVLGFFFFGGGGGGMMRNSRVCMCTYSCMYVYMYLWIRLFLCVRSIRVHVHVDCLVFHKENQGREGEERQGTPGRARESGSEENTMGGEKERKRVRVINRKDENALSH